MNRSHFHHDLVQRQIALGRQTLTHPTVIGGQFAHRMVALRSGQKTSGLALQDNQIVDKLRRHKEVPRCLTMPMASLNKSDDPAAKFNRM